MKTATPSGWDELLAQAFDTYKVLARTRLRSSGTMSADGWYDLAAETAERTAPRREAAIVAALQSNPGLLARRLVEDAHTLAEAAFALITEGLRDEITAKLNSLRAEIMTGRGAPDGPISIRVARTLSATHPDWDAFVLRVVEAFELRMANDLEARTLPDLVERRDAAIHYIASFVKEVMPEELDEVVAIIASSPEVAVRRPAAGQTFEGCATHTLEEAVAEHLVDVFKIFFERNSALAA